MLAFIAVVLATVFVVLVSVSISIDDVLLTAQDVVGGSWMASPLTFDVPIASGIAVLKLHP